MADIQWTNNDFRIIDGDIFNLLDSTLQELVLRIDTIKGDHFLNKQYGCNLYRRVGELNNLPTQMLAVEDLEDALRQDPRIRESSVSVVFLPTSVLTCDITIGENTQRIEVA